MQRRAELHNTEPSGIDNLMVPGIGEAETDTLHRPLKEGVHTHFPYHHLPTWSWQNPLDG